MVLQVTVCSLPISRPTQTADFLTSLWGNYIDACMTLPRCRFYTAMMDCLAAWTRTELILLGKLDPPTGEKAWSTPWYRWGPLHELLQCGALILQHVPSGLWANCVSSRDAKHVLKSDVGAMLSGARVIHMMDLKIDLVGALGRGLPAKAYARRDKQDDRLAALVMNFCRLPPPSAAATAPQDQAPQASSTAAAKAPQDQASSIAFHEHGALVASFILGLPTACWLSKTMDPVQRAFSCAFSQFCLRIMKRRLES